MSSVSELRITAVQNPPYLEIRPLPNGSYEYDGYLFDVWKIIAQSLSLRYRLVPLLEGDFGRLDENGTWTGMVGELAYGRADVALAWLWMREDRLKVIDYLSVPVEQSSDRFYISKKAGDMPSFSAGMFASLLKPLSGSVWWLLLCTLLVLSLALRCTTSCDRRQRAPGSDQATWATCLFGSFMAIVGQGWPATPGSLSGRVVTIVTWLLCIIIVNSYTAVLTSHLTVVIVDRPIRSLKEFSEQSDWMLMMPPDHVHLNDWKTSKDVYEEKLYQRSIQRDRFIPFFRTKESAMQCVQPKVLTYVNIDRLFHLIGADACHVVPLYEQSTEQTQFNYMVMAKGRASLRRSIDQVMRKVREAGILRRLKRRWIQRTDACMTTLGAEPVSFGNAFALLMIVPLGIVASGVIFFLERVWFKLNKNGRRLG